MHPHILNQPKLAFWKDKLKVYFTETTYCEHYRYHKTEGILFYVVGMQGLKWHPSVKQHPDGCQKPVE